MSRSKQNEKILEATQEWKKVCLLGEKSLFTDRDLWTRPIFQEVLKAHATATSPEEAIRALEKASPEAQCLRAEMEWLYRLIQHRTALLPAKKRTKIIDWLTPTGIPFNKDHGLLSDALLGAGVAYTGRGYATNVWKEIRFLAGAMVAWSSLEQKKRESLLESPWEFAKWLDKTDFAQGSMFRHALLFLLFPDEFEGMVSRPYKKKMILLGDKHADKSPVAIDKAILDIRQRLEGIAGTKEVDFFRFAIFSNSGTLRRPIFGSKRNSGTGTGG